MYEEEYLHNNIHETLIVLLVEYIIYEILPLAGGQCPFIKKIS